MADSNVTKKALATALKELMETTPFSKISIGEICERCQMNRKSFYYHFRDKEDLANWIFDTELSEYVARRGHSDSLDVIDALVHYFYDNRSFYRRLLKHDGQNSFAEHFGELIRPILVERLQIIVGDSQSVEFYVNFFADGVVCALKRWLTSADCASPEVFVDELEACVYLLAKHTCEAIEGKGKKESADVAPKQRKT